MPKRVVLIEHGDGPRDDRVQEYFSRNGFAPEVIRPYRGEPLGRPDGDVVASVVYGGPFDVFETGRHPFLVEEHRWIEDCMKRDIPLLGICQGAQSVAHTLGAWVGPRPGEPHEFGYYPVHPTEAGRDVLPGPLHLAQAHFHEFALPAGCELLAYSETFPRQAVRHGEATYAFQFHAEVTRPGFRRWQDAPWAPYGKPGAQSREEQDALAEAHDAAQHDWFTGFLERLFGRAVAKDAGPDRQIRPLFFR